MDFSNTAPSGATRGGVNAVLRLEGLVLLAAATAAYAQMGGGMSLFFACFLLPDVAMLAYLHSSRLGALAYNGTHSTLGPALLALAAWGGDQPFVLLLALVWFAHIGFDRALGYGLKYAEAFGATHLGWRGFKSARD